MNRITEPAAATGRRQRWSARRIFTYIAFGAADSLIVAVSYFVAMELRYEGAVPDWRLAIFPTVATVLAAIYFVSNLVSKMYWRGWRYAGLHDALALAQAVAAASGVCLILDFFLAWRPLPLTVVPVGGLLALLGMGVARFRHQLIQDAAMAFTRRKRQRLLIIGAGRAGQWLARETAFTPSVGYQPVCFVDDDPDKLGQRSHGVVVAGNRHDIGRLVQEQAIDVIVLAITALDVESQREIMAECEQTQAQVKILASMPDLLTHQFEHGLFRDARLEDLLGRPQVTFDGETAKAVLGRSVLITGGAGSIGSELARQVMQSHPEELILVDINESGLFDLAAELKAMAGTATTQLKLVIADVSRAQRINSVFALYRPTVVFHAAAYKHVPLMEAHPAEAITANVLGTYNVCRAAVDAGCERVVFISTDKAVEPSNVMGATKRFGEQIVEAFAAIDKANFCAIRFGNVLGSRGSVVPTFLRQIQDGGPVTVTHRDVSRFFMTIPEAGSLIIEAACQAQGGEIFVLDMGKPVSIMDLARKMIRLHGLRPDVDIHIEQIGLRPGEKMHEALVGLGETLATTRHPRVSCVVKDARKPTSLEDLEQLLSELSELVDREFGDGLAATLLDMASRPEPLIRPAGENGQALPQPGPRLR